MTHSLPRKPAPQMHSGKVKQKISCPTLMVRDISVLTWGILASSEPEPAHTASQSPTRVDCRNLNWPPILTSPQTIYMMLWQVHDICGSQHPSGQMESGVVHVPQRSIARIERNRGMEILWKCHRLQRWDKAHSGWKAPWCPLPG